MDFQIIQKNCFVRLLVAILLFSIFIFSCMMPVYADPTEKEEPSGGWIEVKCDPVPEEFDGSVTVIISNDETDEEHTIQCLKENKYIGRLKLPFGKYHLERASSSNNFFYEATANLSRFEITKDMPAAQLIEVEVIRNEIPEEFLGIGSETLVDEEEASEEQDQEGAPSDTEVQEVLDAPDTEGSEQPSSEDVSKGESSEEHTSKEPSLEDVSVPKERSIAKTIRNIAISVFAMSIFVCIVGLVVYVIRNRLGEDD